MGRTPGQTSIVKKHNGSQRKQEDRRKRKNFQEKIKIENGILLGCKKEIFFTIYNSMDGPGAHYAK